MALNSQHCCVENLTIDGVDKKVVTAKNMWSLMKGTLSSSHASRQQCFVGNCQDGTRPDIVIEFDFLWPDNARIDWAATLVQAAWKAIKVRRRFRSMGNIHLVNKYIAGITNWSLYLDLGLLDI